jgi:UDP-N-acetylglucosamine--N-acetylmuramyl-(pentapeptide) pyrophosphoryl-undecaprenol N-acetylglucosamine transferase
MPAKPLVAIACGGTGGHLFPGIAVGGELLRRGGEVLLLISPKEVDQQAVRSAAGMGVEVLPAVGLSRGRLLGFVAGFLKSYLAARRVFRERMPRAVLAMGGFTSAPPVLAGRAAGARAFLHDSNTIPGKANRWLARVVDQAFVGFEEARERLPHREVVVTGTPVRPGFCRMDPAACRSALKLDPEAPVLLVMGGSQGASGINQLVIGALPLLKSVLPGLQYLHLTGSRDFEMIQAAYRQQGVRAAVRSFMSEMELALGAATVAISRAGGSSLAELAAMQLPAVLVPYPFAADNHQLHNAKAFAEAGAALLLEQVQATPESCAAMMLKLLQDSATRGRMITALGTRHAAGAAAAIADRITGLMQARGRWAPVSRESGDRDCPRLGHCATVAR